MLALSLIVYDYIFLLILLFFYLQARRRRRLLPFLNNQKIDDQKKNEATFFLFSLFSPRSQKDIIFANLPVFHVKPRVKRGSLLV